MTTLLSSSDHSVLLGNEQGEMFILARKVYRVEGYEREIRLDHLSHPEVTCNRMNKVPYVVPAKRRDAATLGEAFDRVGYDIVELKTFHFDNVMCVVGFHERTKQWWIHNRRTFLSRNCDFRGLEYIPLGTSIGCTHDCQWQYEDKPEFE